MTVDEKYDLVLAQIKANPESLKQVQEPVLEQIREGVQNGDLPPAESVNLFIARTEDGRVVLSYELLQDGKVVFGPAFGAEFLITPADVKLPERGSDSLTNAIRAAESDIDVSEMKAGVR